jgi:glutamate racemase
MLGIFDSGIGGLTVVKEVIKRLPHQSIIYFGDTARVPYGNKSPELIKKYAREGVEFLLSKKAQIIVLACNTMSAIAFDDLKSRYKIPIFEMITPAVKKSLETTKNGHIGIIGTRATVESKIYEKKIREQQKNFLIFRQKPNCRRHDDFEFRIFSNACPLFVPLVEEGWIDKPETEEIAKEYLEPLKKAKIDTLILGCTHYPLLKKIIKKVIGPKVKIVDSAEEIAKEISLFFERCGFVFTGTKTPRRHIYVSDKTEQLERIIRRWLDGDIKVEKVSLE